MLHKLLLVDDEENVIEFMKPFLRIRRVWNCYRKSSYQCNYLLEIKTKGKLDYTSMFKTHIIQRF